MAEYAGVTSDSPTDPSSLPASDGASSAGTLNTEPSALRPEPTVPYGRFAEVNHGWRAEAAARAAAEQRAQGLERQSQEYQQRLQALERQLQERAAQPSGTPEEEAQRLAAERALQQLPGYAKMSRVAQAYPAVAQTLLNLQQQVAASAQQQEAYQAQHERSLIRGETSRLRELATDAGLTFKAPEHFTAFSTYVAGIIRANPAAHDAFLAGNEEVLPWAFQQARAQHAANEQAARAAYATSKSALSRVPPPIRGSTPGAPPAPQYDPKDPRGSMAKIHAAAADAFAERRAG